MMAGKYRFYRGNKNWSKIKLKFLSSITYGIGEPPKYVEKGTPLIRATNIRSGEITIKNLVYVNPKDIPKNRIQWLKEGDIIVVRSGAGTGDSSIIPHSYSECIAGFDMIVRSIHSIPSFLGYSLLSSGVKINQIDVVKTRAAQPHLNAEELGECILDVPSISEQTQIANFLDYETAKIDTLIEKQKKLIELLKEKRQAVISHAVTKGLNPDAPMKNSGVEWLGEVPEHWIAGIKLNSLAERSKGSFVNGPFGSDLLSNELKDEGVPVIYIRDLKQSGYLRKSTVCVTTKKAEELEICRVKSGDVLIAKVGDPPGESCVYPIDETDAIITQDVIRIRVDKARVDPYYLAMLLNSDFGKLVIDGISVEATRKRVSLGDFKSTNFILPPLTEQILIVKFLTNQIIRIDRTIQKAEEAINLIQERRTALISATVTGKIDVRDWVAPEKKTAVKEGVP